MGELKRSQVMRLVLLAAFVASVSPSIAMADTPVDYGLRRTWPKSIEEHNQKLRASGWAYLNQHAKNREDLIALAQKCQRYVAKPDYCAIPEMREIAFTPVQRLHWQHVNGLDNPPNK
jgi:hypothetical protein